MNMEQLRRRTALRKAAGLIPTYTARPTPPRVAARTRPPTPPPVRRTSTTPPPAPPAGRYAPTSTPGVNVMVPCRHLGEPTGEKVRCGSCRSTVYLKVFACAELGTCTIGKPVPGVAGCCKECRRYEAPPVDAPARPLPTATTDQPHAPEPPDVP